MNNSDSSVLSSAAVEVTPSPAPRRPGGAARIVITAVTLVLLGGVATTGGFAVAAARRAESERQRIAPGVRIAGIPVGGMTPDEATGKVKDWARTAVQKPVTLVAPVSGRKWNIALSDVGGRFDVAPAVQKAFAVGKDESLWQTVLAGGRERNINIDPAFSFSDKLLEKRIDRIAQTVETTPKNARATMTEGGVVTVATPEERGVKLDIAATKAALLKSGPQSLREGGSANLVITEARPAITAADLGQVNTLLASFHTGYGSSSSNRRHNVELAASHINGTTLAPGETFSYNAIVGPRTPRLGWRDAPTYQDGQVVPGPGGGVCQVSTTLYNAVLRAGMKVVKRSHHSMPVHYVNPGCDATVAYDDIDFQFQNTTNGPVLVSAITDKGNLKFNLYGIKPAEERKIEVESGSKHPAANDGFTVTTYKVIHWADGRVERERLSTDTYATLHPKSDAPARPRKHRAAPTAAPDAQPVVTKPAPASAAPDAEPPV